LKEQVALNSKEQHVTESRHHAETEAERRRLAQAVGTLDPTVLRDLQDLGITAETVALLHVIPLVHVAWANGSVGGDERKLIFEIALLSGIEQDNPAGRQLTQWLDDCPPDEFFEKALRVLRATLDALPPEQAAGRKRDLLSFCTRIAQASGRITGLLAIQRSIRDTEQNLLDRIAATLA
jgi:hypothetical protein